MKVRKPFTRQITDARRLMGLSQEQAAELLNVASATLQKYEAEDNPIHPEAVVRMALVYHEPRLTRLYCENECPIGCRETQCGCGRTIEQIMLDLALEDFDELRQTVVELCEQLRSCSEIGEDGMATLDRQLRRVETFALNLTALRLQASRLLMTKGV